VSSLADSIPTVDSVTSSRFSLVSYLPTYAAVVFLAVLLAGGAPGEPFQLSRAQDRLDALGGVELAAILLGVLLLAVVFQPLQLPLVQLLEGYWPRWLGWYTRIGVDRQRRKRAALAHRADASSLSDDVTAEREARQAVLEAAWQLQRRYPPAELLLPTALGNALRATEYGAGSSYGADTVSWWPRLYVVLGDQMRNVVDDRRNQLDAICRLAATGFVVGLISLAILWQSRWWLIVALVPFAIGVVSYRGAVAAALAYGEAVRTAFDLHRFDLLAQLRIPLPCTTGEELRLNRQLTRFWLQGVPMTESRLAHKPAAGAGAGDE
jgi:hypothetical protein